MLEPFIVLVIFQWKELCQYDNFVIQNYQEAILIIYTKISVHSLPILHYYNE